ncbi:MAG: T9SS type A sorting domain-containing protein [Chitinophagaceae bacterium]
MKTPSTFRRKNIGCIPLFLLLINLIASSDVFAQKYYPAGLGNANLKLWLTAADPTTILTTAGTQAASGNAVAKWKDKSGAGADAVQATGTAQPVYTAGVQNGFGALVFQNTNQYFTGPSGTYQSIVAARNITGTSGGTNYHYLFSSPANTDFSIRNTGGGPGSYSVSYTDGPNGNDWCYNTGSPSKQWVNGTQSLTGNSTNHILTDIAASAVTNTYSISSTFMSRGMFGNDPVYEILAYNNVLSTTQRVLLENYEAAEWGMTGSLPSSGYTIFTPAAAASYNKNLVGIGYTSSTDNFLTNPAGSTDGFGFSSTTTSTGFLNTAGYIMAAHNGQANTVTNNATIPGVSGSNISVWKRSWKLQKTGGNSSGQVTLNFNFSDYNGGSAVSTTNYAILYNATDGSFATGTNKLVARVSTTITASNVAFVVNAANLADGYYTIAYSATSVLPVSFTAFTANAVNEKNQLQWTVADQTGNEVYTVLRSADGINFANIGTVQGNNTNMLTADYSFTDNNPLKGSNYYRIQLAATNSRTIYSAIKLIETNGTQPPVTIYPNPATNTIHVKNNLFNGKAGTLQLFNTSGQAVIKDIRILSAGVTDINIASLAKGIYYLQTNLNGTSTITKITKQ